MAFWGATWERRRELLYKDLPAPVYRAPAAGKPGVEKPKPASRTDVVTRQRIELSVHTTQVGADRICELLDAYDANATFSSRHCELAEGAIPLFTDVAVNTYDVGCLKEMKPLVEGLMEALLKEDAERVRARMEELHAQSAAASGRKNKNVRRALNECTYRLQSELHRVELKAAAAEAAPSPYVLVGTLPRYSVTIAGHEDMVIATEIISGGAMSLTRHGWKHAADGDVAYVYDAATLTLLATSGAPGVVKKTNTGQIAVGNGLLYICGHAGSSFIYIESLLRKNALTFFSRYKGPLCPANGGVYICPTEGGIVFWNGSEAFVSFGKREQYNSIAVSDNKHIFAARVDGDGVDAWDEKGRRKEQLRSPNNERVNSIVHKLGRLWGRTEGRCLVAWNADGVGHLLVGHSADVTCFVVADDGRVYSGSLDHTIRVWDALSDVCLDVIPVPDCLPRALAVCVHPNARRLVAAMSGTVKAGKILPDVMNVYSTELPWSSARHRQFPLLMRRVALPIIVLNTSFDPATGAPRHEAAQLWRLPRELLHHVLNFLL